MRGDETLHPRCLARAVQLEAMELQAKAKGLREEATDRSQRAHQLIEEGVRLRTCPVCYDLLSVGTGLLYAGEQLVHARCWPAEPPAAWRPTLLTRRESAASTNGLAGWTLA
jgi:hypothetical protein